MIDRDQWTVDAMLKFGGSFVRALGEAAQRADGDNLQRIRMTWPEYWAEYEAMGKKLEAEEQ